MLIYYTRVLIQFELITLQWVCIIHAFKITIIPPPFDAATTVQHGITMQVCVRDNDSQQILVTPGVRFGPPPPLKSHCASEHMNVYLQVPESPKTIFP